MKILALRLKNLASLERAEIDFTKEPLCSAGIFAITGPTGAGKSTLLDALCLALYSRTPRYKGAEGRVDVRDVKNATIKQDDVRGILRDGTGEGFAEVDFIGIDGSHYRARWSVNRARNKADGSLQPSEISLKNISTGNSISGKKTDLLPEIERLVGLNFEQFTRSVLLAQGDFTAFLKAVKEEKASLLEKLTGTQVYSEISKRIFEHHRSEAQMLEALKAQKAGIPTFSAEELQALQDEAAKFTALISAEDAALTHLHNELIWHEQFAQLELNLHTAQQDLERKQKNKVEAEEREGKLRQVERMQPVKPVNNELQNTGRQLAQKITEADSLANDLVQLSATRAGLETALLRLETDQGMKKKNEEQALPLLAHARKLDVLLTEKTQQLQKAAQELADALNKQKVQEQKAEAVRKEVDLLQKEAAALSKWKSENEPYAGIAEGENIILSKLKDAEEQRETFGRYADALTRTLSEIEAERQRIQKLDRSKELLEKEEGPLKKEIAELEAALQAIPIKQIETEKIQTEAIVDGLGPAIAHWNRLYNAKKELTENIAALSKGKDDLQQCTTQQDLIKASLSESRERKEYAAKAYDKAKLVAAESVEQLRQQLEKGEPCPVCGSTEHPYTEHNPALDNVLNSLRQDYKEAEKAYTAHLQNAMKSEAQAGELGKNIAALESRIAADEVILAALEKDWPGFNVYEQTLHLQEGETAGFLEAELTAQKKRREGLREQERMYATQKALYEDKNKSLAKVSGELSHTGNDLKDAVRNIRALEMQKANEEKEQLRATKALENLKDQLAGYFSNGQWFDNWQKDPLKFTNKITGFARDWKEKTEKLGKKLEGQKVLEAQIKGLADMASTLSADMSLKEGAATLLKNEYGQLSGERLQLFDGAPVAEAEAGFKQAVADAGIMVDEKKKEVNALKQEITAKEALKHEKEKDIENLKAAEKKIQEKIAEFILAHNRQYGTGLTESSLKEILGLPEEWIEQERASLQQLSDAFNESQTIFREREASLAAHTARRPSAKTKEEVMTLNAEKRAALEEYKKSATEAHLKIRSDELNKKSLGQLLLDIEKQNLVVENWDKLNRVIGSSDGKAFRQIAQQYTLDILLGYANKHLEMLSKRYLLQRIPASLGLQVLDQDMGDEVRTVYSLSGGESFLVSLALALGLASLSSSRMQVESLFIDEGFGALDPHTLNVAMDALERLHNQGRKVGVISHLQEMTERIPVQINVSKEQNGRSKVTILQ